ncbi:hypothetical protein [Bifidobacterium tibiigranuli]|jgi:hypothetical protein|uniref:hypothetical protein n=1 Tax=Bifidobacterium tibiigranuli TaxID=2172043 RepID=UPI0026E921A0|nr:hypothetical protein [Bifidobacterium tibiigranuli]MCI2186248.1 phage tail family protein [Bifidobacterium tibiigranuli]MCI2203926.1 phage tail family protein [Bifidobacterium tibiigranuli]
MTSISIKSDAKTISLTDGSEPYHDGPLRIVTDGLKGLGAVPPRENGIDIPQQDGTWWPSRLTSGGRTISITGEAVGLSSIETANLQDRICDLMTRTLTIIIQDAHGRRHMSGWIAQDPEPFMLMGEQIFTFTLIIYCPDPLKYGDPVTFIAAGGMLHVENAGRSPSWPRLHADNVTSLSLTLKDRTILWTGSNTSLDLDLRDMIPSSGAVSGRAFKIPPGKSIIYVSANASKVSMTVYPAWR